AKASILMAKAIASECIGDLEVAFYIYADALSMAVKRIISSGATSFEHYNKSKLVTPPLDISRNYALARLMHVYTTLELRNSEFDQEVSGLINTSEYFRNYIATKTYYRFNASNLPEYTSISTKDYAFLGECDLYLNLVTDSPLFLSEFSSVHMSLRFWQDGSIYDTYIRNQSDILHQLRSSFSAFFELGSETNVEDFNTNHYESARQLFDELYDIIPKHISNIYLSADRYLTSIPWQLQFLQKFSHRSHLTCLHSISKPSLELAIGKDKGEYKFILSNFHIDNSVKRYLDHKIHDLGTVFDNTNSNKESFLRNLGSSDLFVFIGHGGLKIDNREMKLQLPDQSIIDFKEIKTITSIDPKKLRVAILFSCFSGFSLPSNEDYDENDLGLPTLFKSLGYDFVIATAWPIDLSIACDFVSHFSSLIHSGHSVREAYSIAYNQLYEDYEFSDFLVRGSCIQLYA
ncbi:MAG: CHAT domain-containing protein, partial [Pseudomonadota bacterium]